MPSLLLPFNVEGVDGSSASWPVLLASFRLAGVPFLAKKRSETEYWQQKVKVNGFVIGQSLWVNQKQAVISCQTDEPCAILYYAVEGDIRFRSGTTQKAVLSAGQYCLLVCPAKSSTHISFPTKQHHSIQLSISIHLLQHLPGFQAGISDLPVVSDGPIQLYSSFVPINKPIRSIWSLLLFNARSVQPPDFLRLNEGCLKLLARFNTDWSVTHQQQRWRQRKEIRIQELEAYLADHLDMESRHLTTEEACAKKVGMNMYQFRKLWKERSNTTLTQYLLRSRMEKARQLLVANEGTPATIYMQVGYQDFSSFSRAFSAWYGYSPSQASLENK